MNNENSIFNLIYNNINQVYKALVKVLQSNPSFTVVGEEVAVHQVHVIVGRSMFSAGDELTIKLEGIDENKTKMQVISNVKTGAADNLRIKHGDVIQKLVDKMKAILPPPVMEEAPKPNNLVQVGELSRQMNASPADNHTPTSVTEAMNQPVANAPKEEVIGPSTETSYAYEPKPLDYESLKENESSKHKGNDPLQDLMKNI